MLFGLGYRRTVMMSGVVSMICGAIIVGTQDPVIASFGFLVLGFAIAWAAPAAFGIAGLWGKDAGVVIAAMTTVGYSGFVIGPVLMGRVADEVGLRATMAVLMLATAGIVLGALFRWPNAADCVDGST